jgi:hypothetical protein
MGIRYDSFQDMAEGKYGDFEIVKSEDAGTQTVHIVKIPSLSEGHKHRVAVEDNEGVLLGGLSRSREDIEANFQNAIENIQTDHYTKARQYLEERGFNILNVDKGKNTKNMEVEKDGYNFDLSFHSDIHSENYQFIHRHWDIITSIADDLSDGYGESIFYSTVNQHVDSKLPHAKRESRSIVFSTITDILENRGVRVHS